MTEQEIMEKIKESAKETKIPESLFPENMKNRLDEAKGNGSTDTAGEWNTGRRNYHRIRNVVAAAAVCLVCGTGLFAGYRTMQGGAQKEQMASDATGSMEMAECAPEDGAAAAGGETTEYAADMEITPKRDAGDLYVVAGDYGEIYDRLKEVQMEEKRRMMMDGVEDAFLEMAESVVGGGEKEKMIVYEAEDSGTMGGMAGTGAVTESATADSAANESAGLENYSKTNLQTEGVDESDIIKTDGSYLYIVRDYTVEIIDIRSSMKAAGTISIPLESGADRVVEMYVDGNKLSLIIEREETKLTKSNASKGGGTSAGSSAVADEETTKKDYAVEDAYYMDSERVTELVTYDITDRKNPLQQGSIAQDGYYNTSRKIGDIVYLFTERGVVLPELTKSRALKEENTGGWIPLVDGKAVAADCIYLPERGNNGLLISSVNVETPDTIVDNALILNNHVNIYVSTGSLYLYNTEYTGNRVTTQIAKFSLDRGRIDAVGAASTGGEIYDTFAINESRGKLRVLTTDWSGSENENQLYLFDKNLKLTGSLTGIAKGERIYAARYFGDMAYFVTYRNTDPLFAVDLSDDKNPKILSELKITGFSEYLHFWGKDKLVGIGYETDPDTGRQEGIKLTMFDISNPAELKVAGTLVIKNMDYSPALYNYKCVLADAGENLLGFTANSYQGEWECAYFLFSWEDGKFKEILAENLTDVLGRNVADMEKYRGIYVGDTFYLAHPDSVISYDRGNNYQLIEKYLP